MGITSQLAEDLSKMPQSRDQVQKQLTIVKNQIRWLQNIQYTLEKKLKLLDQ